MIAGHAESFLDDLKEQLSEFPGHIIKIFLKKKVISIH
jgi:hypothetical protein